MDFDFTPEQRAFAADVETFLDTEQTPGDGDTSVFDVTRENMAVPRQGEAPELENSASSNGAAE